MPTPARPLLLATLLAFPAAVRALPLLDAQLTRPDLRAPSLSLLDPAALALAGEEQKPPKPAATQPKAAPGSLDFDLLGEAKPAPKIDEGALRRRRGMLNFHQGLGFALSGLEIATVVVGQLNYNDKFGGPNTDKYRLTHAVLAYTTLGVFAVNGAIALLAPNPLETPRSFDRVMVHRIAMAAAALGMVAEGVLGAYTRSREGYLNQERIATVHLAIGYATLAAMGVGVGALVF
jgi:hypothetical protein